MTSKADGQISETIRYSEVPVMYGQTEFTLTSLKIERYVIALRPVVGPRRLPHCGGLIKRGSRCEANQLAISFFKMHRNQGSAPEFDGLSCTDDIAVDRPVRSYAAEPIQQFAA